MVNNKNIYFDMDGTLVDFYKVPNWLSYLQKQQTKPYRCANPLLNMRLLGLLLKKLQNKGYSINIITAFAKNANETYKQQIKKAKIQWLKRHISAVSWDNIYFVDYGSNKSQIVNHSGGILFDDETDNLNEWTGQAYSPTQIFDILNYLLTI